MLSKATLIFFSYVALMGFAPKTNARIAPIFFKARYRSTNNIQLQEINKTSNVLLANSSGSRAYMTLTSIGRKNAIGNPIYLLSLYVNGEKIDAYPTVTGRAHTQNRDRHISGTEAPLPSGRYSVARSIVKGTHSEVGGRFLPISPRFLTGRSALGIHYDPSFNKKNGQDGTAGCVALTNKKDFDRVLAFVRTHQPQHLDVQF